MSAGAVQKRSLKHDVCELERLGEFTGPNPIKLWEVYNEQSMMWRAMALLHLPATLLATCLALVTFFLSDSRIEIPPAPEPGFYKVDNIPDKVFIKTATRLVNLITSYQPANARLQFREARRMLWQPALSKFEKDYLGENAAIITDTSRSQMFYPVRKRIKLTRYDEFVEVRIPGKRQKMIGQKLSRADEIAWYIRLTTVPPNVHNKFGIVIHDIELKQKTVSEIRKEDSIEARRKARRNRGKKKKGK